MQRQANLRIESWPLERPFRISRGVKTAADVVVVELTDGNHVGRGECVPYPRYGE
ncbi:MAG: L-Ala-D/L-Glu epimerase, partial [Pseudomonadota bacterium]